MGDGQLVSGMVGVRGNNNLVLGMGKLLSFQMTCYQIWNFLRRIYLPQFTFKLERMQLNPFKQWARYFLLLQTSCHFLKATDMIKRIHFEVKWTKPKFGPRALHGNLTFGQEISTLVALLFWDSFLICRIFATSPHPPLPVGHPPTICI